MRLLLTRLTNCFCLTLFLMPPAISTPLAVANDGAALISQGTALRQQGNLLQAIDLLNAADKLADTPEQQAKAAGALGLTYLQAVQYNQAEPPLKKAYQFFTGTERARYAISLGNLAFILKQPEQAKRYYQEALDLSSTDADLRFSAGLNLVRLAPEAERLGQLNGLARQMAKIDSPALAFHHLNLGNQARLLGPKGLPLSYRELELARQLAAQSKNQRLLVEALDAKAQLYEDNGRLPDALALTQQGLAIALTQDQGMVADLLINLEWRQGRILKAQNKNQPALAAYQRALQQIELVRQDIPVVYEDGRSSFRTMLEPIYLGFVELQLQQLDKQQDVDPQSARLRTVIDTMELIKQTELQDFLGDRCAVETVQGGSADLIPPETAVLYPILLADRIELLLRTSNGIIRRTVTIKADRLNPIATNFAASLRAGSPEYLSSAQQLYDWLLRPFDAFISEQGIQAMVVVPDGVLRLVPMAALHDGKQYAIEKYAISMVTGMSVTNTTKMGSRKIVPLLAGVSEPGLVVDKLGPLLAAQIFNPASPSTDGAARGLAQTRSLRSIKPDTVDTAKAVDVNSQNQRKLDKLRARLALPGVKDEINSLGKILGGTSLLDSDFTVENFRQDAESGEYRIVHMASHGVFGGTPETSFIMAHDDVISMNGLQSLLKAEKFQKNPIELLTLSACQTAEGNDRAPLGIAGAAVKARAKSVLGTLWPVEDNAARAIMEIFYTGLASEKLSKTQALRQAQTQLIQQPETEHPFFWAPFVLIGNWL